MNVRGNSARSYCDIAILEYRYAGVLTDFPSVVIIRNQCHACMCVRVCVCVCVRAVIVAPESKGPEPETLSPLIIFTTSECA